MDISVRGLPDVAVDGARSSRERAARPRARRSIRSSLRVGFVYRKRYPAVLAQVLSANKVTAVRTPKDVLITFDFAASGNRVTLGWREWLGSSWSESRAFNGLAQGAVNTADVLNPFDGTTLKAQRFGEAVVNLSDAFGVSGCETFASAFVKARSSDAFTSALKDFIAPVATTINTCRAVDLPNTATAVALNHATVSDSGLITVSNFPVAVTASSVTPVPLAVASSQLPASTVVKPAKAIAAVAALASSSTSPTGTSTGGVSLWTLDTNHDTIISPLDALLVLNRLNESTDARPGYDISLDVNRDGYISALDALLVINHLNGADAESPVDSPAVGADEAWAIDSYFRSVGEDRQTFATNRL